MSNRHLFMAAGFPSAPMGLGIGRYVCQLQRVTLKFCKSSGSSRGLREFLENDLIDYAKENPGVVVYVKPRRHRGPVIKAEYLNGSTHWLSTNNYAREEIIKWMELFRTQYHNGSEMRYRKLWHTDFPSIQGPWTPFTFRNTAQNCIEYPNKELSAADKLGPTATEELIRLFKEQQEAEKLDGNRTEENAAQ